jgi:hypothetical protein
MNTWIRRSLQVGILSAGLVVFGATGAHATGSDVISSGNVGIGNGTQAVAPIQTPVNACGNAAGAVGSAEAGCEGGAQTSSGSANKPDLTSRGNVGIGNGTQAYVPVQAPVNVSGNAATAGGTAAAGSQGGTAAARKDHAATTAGGSSVSTTGSAVSDAKSTGNVGIGNGSQAIAPVQIPANISGNAGSLYGTAVAVSRAGVASASERSKVAKRARITKGANAGVVDLISAGNVGIGNGNQVHAPIQVPVSVCGNSAGASGTAAAACQGTSSAGTSSKGGASDLTSTGNVGIGNGNQVHAPIQVPVNVSGNAVGAVGSALAMSMGGAAAR